MSINNSHNIAGVLLAGGRSSRMGENKALLDYHGKPLIEHMLGILKKTGLEKIFISGEVKGYDCLYDKVSFSGPAEAMKSIMSRLPGYAGFLFIPVDMPLLTAEMLHLLLQGKEGAHFIGWPLPVFITRPYLKSHATSVKGLLSDYAVDSVDLPDRFSPFMLNANTSEDWKEIVAL